MSGHASQASRDWPPSRSLLGLLDLLVALHEVGESRPQLADHAEDQDDAERRGDRSVRELGRPLRHYLAKLGQEGLLVGVSRNKTNPVSERSLPNSASWRRLNFTMDLQNP